jgi:hypothetical protein
MQGNTLTLCANRNPESSRYPRVPRYLGESAAHRADVRCVTLGFDILLPFSLAAREKFYAHNGDWHVLRVLRENMFAVFRTAIHSSVFGGNQHHGFDRYMIVSLLPKSRFQPRIASKLACDLNKCGPPAGGNEKITEELDIGLPSSHYLTK